METTQPTWYYMSRRERLGASAIAALGVALVSSLASLPAAFAYNEAHPLGVIGMSGAAANEAPVNWALLLSPLVLGLASSLIAGVGLGRPLGRIGVREGVRIVRGDGRAAGWIRRGLRSVVAALVLAPLLGGLSHHTAATTGELIGLYALVALVERRGRTLADLLSGTVVVTRDERGRPFAGAVAVARGRHVVLSSALFTGAAVLGGAAALLGVATHGALGWLHGTLGTRGHLTDAQWTHLTFLVIGASLVAGLLGALIAGLGRFLAARLARA